MLSRFLGFVIGLFPEGEAPSAQIQTINEFLHKEPYGMLVHGLFWSLFLMIVPPLVGNILLVLTLIRVVLYLAGLSHRRINVKEGDRELAVVITGCDTGFGQAAAFHLAERGFHVFAGCLKSDSFAQYKSSALIKPIKYDVRSDREAAEFAKAVSTWISANKKKKRALHAIINNAGVGMGGLIDWLPMETFQFCMDVNLYGMVRTTKAFLPQLKQQISQQSYTNARIINITSMAGMVAMSYSAPYFASKHAAEAFSNVLRLEMRDIGILVVTVNPSFHETPLTKDMDDVVRREVWEPLPKSIKNQYGESYLVNVLCKIWRLPQRVMWRPHMVTEQLVEAVELVSPPSKIMVGTDAKLGLSLHRWLPSWLADQFVPQFGTLPNMVAKKATPESKKVE